MNNDERWALSLSTHQAHLQTHEHLKMSTAVRQGRKFQTKLGNWATATWDHSSHREIKIQIPVSGSIESVSLEPGNSHA